MALKKVGAAWKRQSKNGGEMLSMRFDTPVESCMAFANTKKKNDKSPDYNFYIVVDDEEDEQAPPKEDMGDIPF